MGNSESKPWNRTIVSNNFPPSTIKLIVQQSFISVGSVLECPFLFSLSKAIAVGYRATGRTIPRNDGCLSACESYQNCCVVIWNEKPKYPVGSHRIASHRSFYIGHSGMTIRAPTQPIPLVVTKLICYLSMTILRRNSETHS